MSRFDIINIKGIKYYTLFSKHSIKKVLSTITSMSYACQEESRAITKSVYLDSPNNLLSSAGILLSKVVKHGKAFFRVEREEYFRDKRTIIPKEKKVFIHPIGLKDNAPEHSIFLTNGITSMFSTRFHIDLENVFKTVVPKLEIESKQNIFRVLNGKGFKAEIVYERIFIKNYETKRRSRMLMMNIKRTSTIGEDEFKKLTTNLERFCKEMIPTKETQYEIAKKMTAIIKK